MQDKIGTPCAEQNKCVERESVMSIYFSRCVGTQSEVCKENGFWVSVDCVYWEVMCVPENVGMPVCTPAV